MDNLKICPCGKSDGCYEQESENIKTQLCYGCGFMSNSLMKEEEEFYKEQVKTIPQLYKDLIWEDINGQKWMPSLINIEGKGIVFADGKNQTEWKWASAKAIEIPKNERKKYPIIDKPGQYHKYKNDLSTVKHFEKEEFIEALDYIGVFE